MDEEQLERLSEQPEVRAYDEVPAENRYLAARDGLDGLLIDPERGELTMPRGGPTAVTRMLATAFEADSYRPTASRITRPAYAEPVISVEVVV